MDELKAHVDKLFERYRSTSETRELKEEILGNMAAKRDDLMAQGESEAVATQRAVESLTSLDGLVDNALLLATDDGPEGWRGCAGDLGGVTRCESSLSGEEPHADVNGRADASAESADSDCPRERAAGSEKGGGLVAGVLCLCAVVLTALATAYGPGGLPIWDLAPDWETSSKAEDLNSVSAHDIAVVEDFRSPYVGDASNTSHLFSMLPLREVPFMIQIDSNTCALTVNYLDTVWNLGEEDVRCSLVYNTVAAMAAIDNLSAVTYEFSGDSYAFERAAIEDAFGSPLSALLDDPALWNERVRDPLGSTDLVDQFYS